MKMQVPYRVGELRKLLCRFTEAGQETLPNPSKVQVVDQHGEEHEIIAGYFETMAEDDSVIFVLEIKEGRSDE